MTTEEFVLASGGLGLCLDCGKNAIGCECFEHGGSFAPGCDNGDCVRTPIMFLEDEDSGTAGFYCGPCGRGIAGILNDMGHMPEVELLS